MTQITFESTQTVKPVLTITSSMAAFFDGDCDDYESLLCQGIETDIHLLIDTEGTDDFTLTKIGEVYSRVIRTAVGNGRLLDWADNKNQAAYDAILVYQEILKESCADGLCPRRALWIDTVEIDEQYRGFDYSLQAVSLLLATLDIDFPFLQAAPIEVRQQSLKELSKQKLSNHWRKLGLKNLSSSDWLYATDWDPPAEFTLL